MTKIQRHIVRPSYLIKSFNALYNIHATSFISLSFRSELLTAIQTHCDFSVAGLLPMPFSLLVIAFFFYLASIYLSFRTLLRHQHYQSLLPGSADPPLAFYQLDSIWCTILRPPPLFNYFSTSIR